jgi:hypothetical protein
MVDIVDAGLSANSAPLSTAARDTIAGRRARINRPSPAREVRA